jgi:AcrR family transcriptional regulator
MSERGHFEAPARERRSHADRTAQTRARIKQAVVDGIAEVGFQRTTATEIARRAGVSWGAVQHQFGDKTGILIAVLEESFARFAERLGEAPGGPVPLAKRVSIFVDRAWAHFGSDEYRSTFEILLNLHLPDSGAEDAPWYDATLETWQATWAHFFPHHPLSPRRLLAIQHYTISVLSGLASMRVLEGPTGAVRGTELEYLKETLVRELSRAGTDRSKNAAAPASPAS